MGRHWLERSQHSGVDVIWPGYGSRLIMKSCGYFSLINMDSQTLLTSGGLTGGIVIIILALTKVLRHSRCRSRCCGEEISVRTDLSPTNSSSHLISP